MHGLLPGGERLGSGCAQGCDHLPHLSHGRGRAGARAQRAEPNDGTGGPGAKTAWSRRPRGRGWDGEAGHGMGGLSGPQSGIWSTLLLYRCGYKAPPAGGAAAGLSPGPWLLSAGEGAVWECGAGLLLAWASRWAAEEWAPRTLGGLWGEVGVPGAPSPLWCPWAHRPGRGLWLWV